MFDYLTLYLMVAILSIHYIADFPFQTSAMALGKSSCNKALSKHIVVYTAVTTLLSYIFIFFVFNLPIVYLPLLSIWVYMTHFYTDYITSRMCARYFGKKDYHMGFVIVGVDQLIHYATLLAFYIKAS
jgi:hypothetical protein